MDTTICKYKFEKYCYKLMNKGNSSKKYYEQKVNHYSNIMTKLHGGAKNELVEALENDNIDYAKEIISVNKASKVNISIAHGGGWAAILTPK